LATLINGIVVLFIAGKSMIESSYERVVKGRDHAFDTGKEKKQ